MLTQDKKPLARIVLPADSELVEQHAAEELQRFLCEMSGAKLSIEHIRDAEGSNIFIGAAATQEGLDLSEDALGFDGYVVRTVGPNLLLTGRKPYSSLYAVYHLLERHLGCGFFEDGDQVPRRETIALVPINEVCKPRFEWRMYHLCMEYAYSGMRWWEWEELKPWVDWMVKKRYNMWDPCRLASYSGIGAIAAGKLGIPIELTDFQKKQSTLMRRTLDYARMMGIRIVHSITEVYSQTNQEGPGTYSYPDRLQLEEFVRAYEEKVGQVVPVLWYEWCGTSLPVLDPRSPITKRFVTAVVEAYTESLGSGHLYTLGLPSEGGWKSDDPEEMNRVTYSMLMGLIDAVKVGDPSATIFTGPPFPYNKTFEAQKQAVQDALLPIMTLDWLNIPGRLQSFQMFDYYWGLPWTTGMTGQCGKETNPGGDLQVAIRNARELAADPEAAHCLGFCVSSETNHRNLIMMDLFSELSWNPADVDAEGYLRRWTARRYGPHLAGKLHASTEAIASSLLSFHIDLRNGPLYRYWRGPYLPGLTPTSVKRTLGYLPKLREALETLLSEHASLESSSMYRFDLVDLGRTYLGAIFNDRLARARKALRAQDEAAFEKNAKEIEGLMHFMAQYCSAHSQFRLKTFDDWAGRWPQILPGYENRESNWITYTALISPEAWRELLDYSAEDLAELVEHYFWPRVALYLRKMREQLEARKDISGRLVYRGTDTDMPYRVGDFAPPRGNLPWSPYGATCEPELTGEDDELAHTIIQAGTVSGRFDFYEGPMDALVRTLLDHYPVPEDLEEILMESGMEVEANQAPLVSAQPGEVLYGFRTPEAVEDVVFPKELNYLIHVEEVSKEYNIMRGGVARHRVQISDFVKLVRLPNAKAAVGDHQVAVFEFELLGHKYILRYDGGSAVSPAGFVIDADQTISQKRAVSMPQGSRGL
ncbi:MAG: alpha-N-acetylglucosaminidase C-terminal domain-containing protein [Candidatus Latescibacterota bacterium]